MRILRELVFLISYLAKKLILKTKYYLKRFLYVYGELYGLIVFISLILNMAELLNNYVVTCLIVTSILSRLFLNKLK